MVDVPELRKDEIEAEQEVTKINIQHDMHRAVFDRSQPTYINGTKIGISVPFSGDKEIFYVQPTRFNLSPPHAIVRDGVWSCPR